MSKILMIKMYFIVKCWLYLLLAMFIWIDFQLGKALVENIEVTQIATAKDLISTRLIAMTFIIAIVEGLENLSKLWK